MPTTTTLLAFALAATLLIIVPGPNVLYIVTRGIEQGRPAAIASALGVELGMLVHTAAAVLGLSALVASSRLLFSVVTYAGAAYLVWLGIQAIHAPRDATLASDSPMDTGTLRRVFFHGVVVNVLNPKVGIFFLAFLPQFVDPPRGDASMQVLVLGLLFVTIATLSDLAYAAASGTIGAWLRRRESVARYRTRASGVVYVVLGLAAALSGSGSARKG